MTNHFFRIAFATIAIAALAAPLTAQQRGRGVFVEGQRGNVTVDDGSPRPEAFSVSLVLGDMQAATSTADNVPAAARKALTDVKDFLPYKSYRLLDSQWTLCCGRRSIVTSPIVTRLRGPEEQDYNVEIVPNNAGNGKYYVHFSLWEPRSAEGTELTRSSAVNTAQERADLERQLEELRKTNGENHPDVVRLRRRLDSLDSQSAASRDAELARRTLTVSMARRAIIDTSFTMDIGETVVVGTSRLKGDKALIALLTAVAPTKSTTK
jgi:hypothetical protein